MKLILSLITIIIFFASNAQTISTTRMGDIRLGMTIDEIESVTGKKVSFIPKTDEYAKNESNFTHQNVNYLLGFNTEKDSNTGKLIYRLIDLETKSSNIKTLSGIHIGKSLDDLWNAYKNYNISIWRMWEDSTEGYSKKRRAFEINDDEAYTTLRFELYNNKIVKITLYYNEGGC